MLAKIQWPQAAVVIAMLVCVSTTALAGPSLGVSLESLRFVLGGEGVLAMLGAWFLKAPGAK
jgi:hypothetical protein